MGTEFLDHEYFDNLFKEVLLENILHELEEYENAPIELRIGE